MIEYDETMQFDEEMGALLIESYHQEPDDYPVWDDWVPNRVTFEELMYLCTEVSKGRGWAEKAMDQLLVWLRCDQCGTEELHHMGCSQEEPDERDWQVLVPIDESPHIPTRIVNCPACAVAR